MKENTPEIVFPHHADITIYSEETKHLFSKEDQHFFEIITKKMPTNLSYLITQKSSVIKGIQKIFADNPNLPLRQVIIKELTLLPDFLDAENLTKVVGYITQTWEKCQAEANEKVSV